MYINLDLLDRKVKKINHVIAGPWVGEFGWELMCYQAYLRYLKENNPHLKTFTIISKSGHAELYKDFATNYVEYNTSSIQCTGALCYNWTYDNIHQKIITSLTTDKYLWIPTNTFIINYHLSGPNKQKFMKDFIQKQYFISFKKDINKSKLMLIHARDTKKFNSDNRNWKHENWDKITENLLKMGYTVKAIGRKTQCYTPKLAEDYTNIDLKEVIMLMSKACCIVGTSSGPMHLASLCQLPHIVLSIPDNKIRYEQDWNPLNTHVKVVVDDYWNPSVEKVMEEIYKIL